jgi:FkbM family methyltransferase
MNFNSISNFFTALLKATTSPTKSKISFSQYAEDLLIQIALKETNPNTKFYVDIGCHHPKRGSNSYYFYKKGWRGILVDLEDVKVLACKIARPRDQVIKAAISNKKEIVSIFSPIKYSTNSTIRLDTIEDSNQYQHIGLIETTTLNEVLENQQAPRNFGFLSIDVEGSDLQVLQSIDLNKYTPSVLCIENWQSKIGINAILESETHRYLEKSGYRLSGWSGLSTVYLRKLSIKP